jgi:predicted metal-dependent phosphoesterase TrpH
VSTADATVLADLHMHTLHSWDCTTSIDDLLDAAVAAGLGAVAVTDHNTIAGGVEARARAIERGLPLHVIVGSELKTAADGEVIGLFLHDELPRGLAFGETIERIHAQGGVVYVPHPFDRFHSTPEESVLREHVGSIDVLETANARLWLERDNRRAEHFAREHGLRRGAGSDAHVPEGIGTGALRLAAFDDPVSFLAAVDDAEIVRRPRSMLRLQIAKRRLQRTRGASQ